MAPSRCGASDTAAVAVGAAAAVELRQARQITAPRVESRLRHAIVTLSLLSAPCPSSQEVIPYLVRRAEENSAVLGKGGRDLAMVQAELLRRTGLRR